VDCGVADLDRSPQRPGALIHVMDRGQSIVCDDIGQYQVFDPGGLLDTVPDDPAYRCQLCEVGDDDLGVAVPQ